MTSTGAHANSAAPTQGVHGLLRRAGVRPRSSRQSDRTDGGQDHHEHGPRGPSAGRCHAEHVGQPQEDRQRDRHAGPAQWRRRAMPDTVQPSAALLSAPAGSARYPRVGAREGLGRGHADGDGSGEDRHHQRADTRNRHRRLPPSSGHHASTRPGHGRASTRPHTTPTASATTTSETTGGTTTADADTAMTAANARAPTQAAATRWSSRSRVSQPTSAPTASGSDTRPSTTRAGTCAQRRAACAGRRLVPRREPGPHRGVRCPARGARRRAAAAGRPTTRPPTSANAERRLRGVVHDDDARGAGGNHEALAPAVEDHRAQLGPATVRGPPRVGALGDAQDRLGRHRDLDLAVRRRPLQHGRPVGAGLPAGANGVRTRLEVTNPSGFSTWMRCSPSDSSTDLLPHGTTARSAPVRMSSIVPLIRVWTVRPPTSTVGPKPHTVPVGVAGSRRCWRFSMPSTSSSEMPTPSRPAGPKAVTRSWSVRIGRISPASGPLVETSCGSTRAGASVDDDHVRQLAGLVGRGAGRGRRTPCGAGPTSAGGPAAGSPGAEVHPVSGRPSTPPPRRPPGHRRRSRWRPPAPGRPHSGATSWSRAGPWVANARPLRRPLPAIPHRDGAVEARGLGGLPLPGQLAASTGRPPPRCRRAAAPRW